MNGSRATKTIGDDIARAVQVQGATLGEVGGDKTELASSLVNVDGARVHRSAAGNVQRTEDIRRAVTLERPRPVTNLGDVQRARGVVGGEGAGKGAAAAVRTGDQRAGRGRVEVLNDRRRGRRVGVLAENRADLHVGVTAHVEHGPVREIDLGVLVVRRRCVGIRPEDDFARIHVDRQCRVAISAELKRTEAGLVDGAGVDDIGIQAQAHLFIEVAAGAEHGGDAARVHTDPVHHDAGGGGQDEVAIDSRYSTHVVEVR